MNVVRGLGIVVFPALGLASFISAIGACTSDGNVGEMEANDGGLLDGRDPVCGNGLDENGNGVVDEGCPCNKGDTQKCYPGPIASRGVGACKDGTAVCSATGEFGLWGGECAAAVVPTAEQCNGIDDDCDGAVDEGCSCGKAGEQRACGQSNLPSPCKQGLQRCGSDGTWGNCEGQVLPSAEVCGDKVDNDCDGKVDNGCNCTSPVPEICDNGKDDDCDDTVDEASCTPADAGAGGSGGAGGTGGGGNAGGGAGGSGGQPPTCAIPTTPQCYAVTGDLIDLGPSDEVGDVAASTGGEMGIVGTGRFLRIAADGTLIDSRDLSLLRGIAFDEYRKLLWTGNSYVVAWSPDDGLAQMQLLSSVGELVGPRVVVGTDSDLLQVDWVDGTLVAAWSEAGTPATIHMQKFDGGLQPLGPSVQLNTAVEQNGMGAIHWLTALNADQFVVSGLEYSPSGSLGSSSPTLVFVSGTSTVGYQRLPDRGAPYGGTALLTSDPSAHLGASCGRSLVWWVAATNRSEPFPAGGSRQAMAPRMMIVDPAGNVVAPAVEPVGERFGLNMAAIVSLGDQGFFVMDRSDASVFEGGGSGKIAVGVRITLDGQVLQTIDMLEEGWASQQSYPVAIPTAKVGDCVLTVRMGSRYGSADSTFHRVARRYCPSACP